MSCCKTWVGGWVGGLGRGGGVLDQALGHHAVHRLGLMEERWVGGWVGE